MQIAMVGVGYVGLVSGACFSDFGHGVTCIDKNAAKIQSLTDGKLPIYEPGLDVIVARNVAAKRMKFTTDLKLAVADADVVFVAVGTPARRGDGHADLTYVFAAAEEIAATLTDGTVVVTKSTVPVGTNRKVEKIIRQARPDLEFEVASNPEFLREGAAIDDFMRPDRVIIGADSELARNVMAQVYRPLFLREFPIVYTSLESAEMIKYAANAFLATKISFINEVAALCEMTGADVKDVAKGMGLDKRIGDKFLHAGPGYGGSCFPKDTHAFVHMGQENSCPQKIVEAVTVVNEGVKLRMVEKILKLCEDEISGKTAAILGVTFKPNTDDMRDAPALAILPALMEAGANVRIADPQGRREGEALLPGVTWCTDAYDAVEGADVLVILTEWNEFRALDLKRLSSTMSTARMADLRNIYNRDDVLDAGFVAYTAVGI